MKAKKSIVTKNFNKKWKKETKKEDNKEEEEKEEKKDPIILKILSKEKINFGSGIGGLSPIPENIPS